MKLNFVHFMIVELNDDEVRLDTFAAYLRRAYLQDTLTELKEQIIFLLENFISRNYIYVEKGNDPELITDSKDDLVYLTKEEALTEIKKEFNKINDWDAIYDYIRIYLHATDKIRALRNSISSEDYINTFGTYPQNKYQLGAFIKQDFIDTFEQLEQDS